MKYAFEFELLRQCVSQFPCVLRYVELVLWCGGSEAVTLEVESRRGPRTTASDLDDGRKNTPVVICDQVGGGGGGRRAGHHCPSSRGSV